MDSVLCNAKIFSVDFVTRAPPFVAKVSTSYRCRRSRSDILQIIMRLWQPSSGRFFLPLDSSTILYFKNLPQACTDHFVTTGYLHKNRLLVKPRGRRVFDQFLSVHSHFDKSTVSPMFHNHYQVFRIDYLNHYLRLL